MRIVLIPDEYTADPATAFELGRRWGVEHFEIRQAYRWRVPVAPAWAADRVAAMVAEYGVSITAISPGLFKPTMRTDGSMVPISTDQPAEIRRHLDELLPRFFEFAERLGTRNVTVFALPRPKGPRAEQPPQIVVESLAEAAEKAAAAGFLLLLENGGGSWADSAPATAGILQAVGSPALRLTWDPANVAHARLAEDPVREGYPQVAAFTANVHVKDVQIVGGQPAWAMLGEGRIDWPEQLRRLAGERYDGPLTLEPHLQYQPGRSTNLVAMAEEFLRRARRMLEEVGQASA